MRKSLLLPLVALCFLSACSKDNDDKKEAPAALVKTEASIIKDVPYAINAVGITHANTTVLIVPRVAAELKEILVSDGDFVEEDQLLFVLDKSLAELSLKKATANLAFERQRLKKSEVDLQKSEQLTQGGYASSAAYEEALVGVAGLRASVQVAEASLEEAKLNLSYCEIRSPISGKASDVKVDQGNLVSPGSSQLLIVEELSPAIVTFSIPERYLPDIRTYMSSDYFKTLVTTKSGEKLEGKVTYIGTVESVTGTIPMKATFTNTNNQLWPGEFVNVELHITTHEDVVTVPSRAVTIGPDGPFVFVVGDDLKAEYRIVAPGVEYGGLTVISDGLKSDEKVVLEGHVRIVDGTQVRLFEEAAEAATEVPAEAATEVPAEEATKVPAEEAAPVN